MEDQSDAMFLACRRSRTSAHNRGLDGDPVACRRCHRRPPCRGRRVVKPSNPSGSSVPPIRTSATSSDSVAADDTSSTVTSPALPGSPVSQQRRCLLLAADSQQLDSTCQKNHESACDGKQQQGPGAHGLARLWPLACPSCDDCCCASPLPSRLRRAVTTVCNRLQRPLLPQSLPSASAASPPSLGLVGVLRSARRWWHPRSLAVRGYARAAVVLGAHLSDLQP